MLIKAERHHYNRLFSDYKNNSSKLWTHVKEIINKNKSNNKITKYIISNGKTVTDSNKYVTINSFITGLLAVFFGNVNVISNSERLLLVL